MVTRRITYRLYPSRAQENVLFLWRRLHVYLYNACVEHRRTSYKRFGKSVNYFDQQNALPAFKECWPEYKALGSHALQATVKRVDFAFQRFFKGLGKYPRFKSIHRYSGWTYPDKAGWKALSDDKNGYLQLSNLGKIQMRGQARQWGEPTTCTIVYRPSENKWYASITVRCEPMRRTTEAGAVGIDLGCKDAITFSTGEKKSKPDFIRAGDRKVKAKSKALRRKRAPHRKKKVKASCHWLKARKQVSKLQRKIARQRADWIHQVTSKIVSRNSLVAGEKLNTKSMTRKGKRKSKRGLNRSILSVGFATISTTLAYKLAEAGGFYVESPTRQLKPTQRCAVCWKLTPKLLSERIHMCKHCGHREDRDVNAAQVNLAWARGQELSSSDAERASATDCGSMRQLGARKCRKPPAQPEAAGA